MSTGKIGILALALIVAIGGYSAAFKVQEWELALKLRLGKIVDSDYEPGLHFLLPMVNNVLKFDARIQTLDAEPQRFLTAEKKDVIVDSFVKWRITDVAQYYRSTGGRITTASRLLSERINTSLRDEFGKRSIQDVISGERTEIMALLTKDSDAKAAELGIEVIDVRVKQIDLPQEVSGSVFDRMRAERLRVASELRARGAEEAEKIRANADRQGTIIIAEAYKKAEELRGTGDAQSSEIYATAYNQNREFYSFYRSLNAYRKVFNSGGNLMVLEPDSEFFKYFNNMNVPQ
ncbi:MAG: protease modulator HflC [Candidatus Polarisedimenticolaceae bacterium]|nr:protease modulator HflC [Candidatus Polarisedimenticolaceae bacterium]